MKAHRNGKIEFLRFFFSIIIVLFHSRDAVGLKNWSFRGLTFFSHGRTGVEFFFLLSGYFMAAAAFSVLESDPAPDLSRETVLFTFKKFRNVFFPHLLAFLPLLAAKLIFLENDSVFLTVVKSLPNFLFLSKSGAAEFNVIEAEWYISKMLLSGVILFPLLLRFGKTFSRLVCPVLGFLLAGYIVRFDGVLGNIDAWVFGGFVPKVFVRAFAEMSLGVFLYEIVGFIGACNLTSRSSGIAFAVVEFLLYAVSVYFMLLPSGEYEIYTLWFLFAALAISLSGISATDPLFNNSFCRWLGRLSLPVYLCQGLAFGAVRYSSLSALPSPVRLIIVMLLVPAVSIPVMYISSWLEYKMPEFALPRKK